VKVATGILIHMYSNVRGMAKREDRVYWTTAFKQNDRSRSVRATIPEPIAVLLGVEDRTEVEWRVDGETRRVWVGVKKG
jgi:hypothetical protein